MRGIFTEFRETHPAYLLELLSGRGWGINQFHGQLSADDKAPWLLRPATAISS